MANSMIADIFFRIADLLELQDVQWKPQVYRKAARVLLGLKADVSEILEKEGTEGLEKIPGVGEALAKKIVQFLETGKINEYERLKAGLPKGFAEMLDVEGLGPKRAKIIYKKLGIKNIRELKKAIARHRIASLPGFGEKSEKSIFEGIKIFEKGRTEFSLEEVLPIAEKIIARLKKIKGVEKALEMGSVRRRKPIVHDLDILAVSENPEIVAEVFSKMPEVKKVFGKGKTKVSVVLKNSLQVDLRIVPMESFGSASLYFTGSKDYNIWLRQIAIKKGYKLSEYGLFDRNTNKLVAGKTEEEVYKKLGLEWIPPEQREIKK